MATTCSKNINNLFRPWILNSQQEQESSTDKTETSSISFKKSSFNLSSDFSTIIPERSKSQKVTTSQMSKNILKDSCSTKHLPIVTSKNESLNRLSALESLNTLEDVLSLGEQSTFGRSSSLSQPNSQLPRTSNSPLTHFQKPLNFGLSEHMMIHVPEVTHSVGSFSTYIPSSSSFVLPKQESILQNRDSFGLLGRSSLPDITSQLYDIDYNSSRQMTTLSHPPPSDISVLQTSPELLEYVMGSGFGQNTYITNSSFEINRTKKQRPKRFQCSHCNASFGNNGQLKGHIRIHTGERPFVCDHYECGKTFTRNEELTRHKRIHTGVKPFPCRLCGKCFGRKDHLKKHVRTHQRAYFMSFPVCPYPEVALGWEYSNFYGNRV